MSGVEVQAGEASPCVGICALNAAGERCLGCHRTLAEIAGWMKLSSADQQRLKRELERRASEADDET